MSDLFSPLTLRSITLRNRIGVSPMCQYSSTDGFANDWHLVHLGGLAVGGAALVLTEATAVLPEGRINVHDLGLWDDAHIPGLRRITDFVQSHGAVPGTQLAHAGRKASVRRPWDEPGALSEAEGGWTAVDAPSAMAFAPGFVAPRALSEAGIERVIAAFRNAAVRALAAGFQVVEVHAAHGYLLHEFLSPLSNQRTDAWGGSLANRMRLPLEVTRAIRTVWPDHLPLLMRISATDWTAGGWTPDDSVVLARELAVAGVDLLDCSTGGNVPNAAIPVGPGYQVEFARRIRRDASIATAAVGLITDATEADAIVARGDADMVFMARELLRNPRWPLAAAHALGVSGPWPSQYLRGRPRP